MRDRLAYGPVHHVDPRFDQQTHAAALLALLALRLHRRCAQQSAMICSAACDLTPPSYSTDILDGTMHGKRQQQVLYLPAAECSEAIVPLSALVAEILMWDYLMVYFSLLCLLVLTADGRLGKRQDNVSTIPPLNLVGPIFQPPNLLSQRPTTPEDCCKQSVVPHNTDISR